MTSSANERRPGPIPSLQTGSRVHLMGICGTAMASLAGILKGMGYVVSGSDQNVYPPMSTQLAKLGIPILEGYRRENLSSKPDLVIVGNVITRKMEEAQALLESDIPFTSLPSALGHFVIGDRQSLVVAGTHGKTTTTSLLAWVAQYVGLNPGFLIGGIPVNFGQSFAVPAGDHFVIEGDEYDTAFFDKVPKFNHYKPRHVILTSVEFDHADIYKDLEHVKSAFAMLLERIPAGGTLVFNGDDQNIKDLLGKRAYGFSLIPYHGSADLISSAGGYRIGRVTLEPDQTRFEIVQSGAVVAEVETQLFGRYNLENVLSVFALARHLGWDVQKVKEAIARFQGVKRRQEIIGRPRGCVVIEDFAHHPTAVRVTLEGIRERFQNRRIFAVFEPRSATSRRRVFQKAYAEAFGLADECLFSEVYNSQALDPAERFSSDELVSDIQRGGRDARSFLSVDGIVDVLEKEVKSGDVIVIMSNGAFGGIYQKVLARLA